MGVVVLGVFAGEDVAGAGDGFEVAQEAGFGGGTHSPLQLFTACRVLAGDDRVLATAIIGWRRATGTAR